MFVESGTFMSFEDLANQNDWRGERSRFFPYPGRYNITVHCWGKFVRVIAFAGHEYSLGEARMCAELNYEVERKNVKSLRNS